MGQNTWASKMIKWYPGKHKHWYIALTEIYSRNGKFYPCKGLEMSKKFLSPHIWGPTCIKGWELNCASVMKTEYLSWSEYLVSELYQMMQEGMILYIMNYYFNMQIKFGQI
jgi:hypothetical protein